MSRMHKRSRAKIASRASRKPGTAHSVKDLLARAVPALSQVADQSARQAFWRAWLAPRLPPELPPRICAITARDGALTLFTDSPAWSARLRYALQDLQAPLRETDPDIKEVIVRVMPRQVSPSR